MVEQIVQQLMEKLPPLVIEKMELAIQAAKKKDSGPEPEWFSINQVAKLTNLSPDHIRRNVIAGFLPASNTGTSDKPHYRIRRKDIDTWMEKLKETPQSPPRKGKKAKLGPGSYVSRHHKPATTVS